MFSFVKAVKIASAKAVMIGAIVAPVLVSATTAHGQIQIGGNEADFKARLSAEGYNRIDTQKIGLSNSKFHACRGDRRYEIKFEWTGAVDTKVIGKCRTRITAEAAAEALAAEGYTRISIEDVSGRYVAIACQGNRRIRVTMNYMGDVRGRRALGQCRQELSPEDITARLRRNGYDRISFTDRQLPRYVANACKGNTKVELIMNRRGEIRSEVEVGRCQNEINPRQIVASLEGRGLTKVRVTDGKLPRYKAEACRGNNRVEISMNRYGDIRDEVVIGKCRNRYSVVGIEDLLREAGMTSISVRKSGRDFIARGCRDNRYNEYRINSIGEVTSQKERGSCKAPTINALAETLRKRGIRNLEMFAEGCQKGRRIRITFDDFANRTNTEDLGRCRVADARN